MISKIIQPGKSFAGVCRYLCENIRRAEVILSQGVRDYDHKLMAQDFEQQRRSNPGLQSPVQHIILSYYPGEKLDNELLAGIAREYLEKVGISNTQFVVVKHNDRDHLHTHIICNRVDNDGKTIRDSFLGLRGKKAAQALTLQYGLKQALQKDLQLTHLERMNHYEATRYEIFRTVAELLPKCNSIDELKKRLAACEIELIFKYKGQTREVQGLSFKKGAFKYKGSEIDREFSYRKLSKKLVLQQSQKQVQRGERLYGLDQHQGRPVLQRNRLLEELLKPEREQEQTPHELLQKKRKHKHKGLGL